MLATRRGVGRFQITVSCKPILVGPTVCHSLEYFSFPETVRRRDPIEPGNSIALSTAHDMNSAFSHASLPVSEISFPRGHGTVPTATLTRIGTICGGADLPVWTRRSNPPSSYLIG